MPESRPTLPSVTPEAEPSRLSLGKLWGAFAICAAVIIAVEAFLYEVQRPNNVESGTVGSLLNPQERVVIQVLMTIFGAALLACLCTCVRFTTRLRAGRPN